MTVETSPPKMWKATYARIIWPPSGSSSPRTPLFSTVSEINVRDPYTIEFTLKERPKSFILGAFASGWNIIVRKRRSRTTTTTCAR